MENQRDSYQSQVDFIKSRNLYVLLTDDNRVNQFLGKRILKNIGVSNVDLASDGDEAFELVKNNDYDIILTDVEMPIMNGYELAMAVHAAIPEEKLPLIIALTANASDDDRETARKSGIDDYLTKPYSPQDLIDVIMKHCGKADLMFFEEINTVEKSSAPGLQKLYSLFHSNPDDIRHFLSMLSQQIPELIAEMRKGILKDDWEKAFQAAHKLKSPITMLGDTHLATGLGNLTENLRHRRQLNYCPTAFDALLPALESVIVLINSELEKPELNQ
jgi:two-component system sensor histidine kinase/response regulator